MWVENLIIYSMFLIHYAVKNSDVYSNKWKMYIHPEGNVYHKRSTNTTTTAVQINVMTEDSSLDLVSKALTFLEQKLVDLGNHSAMPKEIDAFIGIVRRGDKSHESLYYLVDHNKRAVFWLDEVDLSPGNIYRHYFCNTTIESEVHLRMY